MAVAGRLIFLALCLICRDALAQPFPERPVRLMVGQAAGTATDIVARTVAAKWGETLRAPIVVENRPGAGESIAADAVARATPDGYTLLFGSIASHGIGPALNKNLPYDPQRDFAPISLVGTVPNVLVINPGVPAHTLAEFVAYARANPGKINYASTGVGTSTHLGMELLKAKTGMDLGHVAYKSGPAAFADVISGQVAAGLFNLPSQLAFIRSGKVRALGVSSSTRTPQLAGVPTLAEAGVAGYEVVVWYAAFAPAGTPKPVQARLHDDLVRSIRSPDLHGRLSEQLGVHPVTSTPEELAAYSQREIRKWESAAREAGVPTQ
jgi:tripartite-type tricarboxylate transporter receptor subunit TctC